MQTTSVKLQLFASRLAWATTHAPKFWTSWHTLCVGSEKQLPAPFANDGVTEASTALSVEGFHISSLETSLTKRTLICPV